MSAFKTVGAQRVEEEKIRCMRVARMYKQDGRMDLVVRQVRMARAAWKSACHVERRLLSEA